MMPNTRKASAPTPWPLPSNTATDAITSPSHTHRPPSTGGSVTMCQFRGTPCSQPALYRPSRTPDSGSASYSGLIATIGGTGSVVAPVVGPVAGIVAGLGVSRLRMNFGGYR
jgi:hypothetical protein